MPEESKTMKAALEKLKLALASRERAPSSITSYLQTATGFLVFLGEHIPPAKKDYARYFLHRQKEGKSERTLAKEYAQLKLLAEANNWPFIYDRPIIVTEAGLTPAFTPDEIEAMIKAQGSYSRGERFYLAVSTTWGLRREEMVRMRKRDYNETYIKIKTAKRGQRVEHVIPEEIKPILLAYRPKLKGAGSFSPLFYRIVAKAGLERRKGYGWHSVRRTLRALLELNLTQQGLPPSLVADFMGMSAAQKSIIYGTTPTGIYAQPELSDDRFAVERLVLKVHPFLQLWASSE